MAWRLKKKRKTKRKKKKNSIMKYMNIVSISLMWMSLSIAPMSCAEKEVVNNLEALMPDNNRIIGKVHCEGKGLEGVIVTDGTNFCTTSYIFR